MWEGYVGRNMLFSKSIENSNQLKYLNKKLTFQENQVVEPVQSDHMKIF